MKRIFAVAILALAMAGCATTGSLFGPTPEAQIVTGANAVTAASTLGTVLLKNDKISVTQAKSYSAILHTAGGHLESANATLVACRLKTGSTQKTSPDPCAATVSDDIALAIQVVGDVQKTLKAKE
jgi:low affinity Fe/Cu permease